MHISLASNTTRQEEWEQNSWCWRFSTSWVCRWCHQVLHVSSFPLPWSPPCSYSVSSFAFPGTNPQYFYFPLGDRMIILFFLHKCFFLQGPLCCLHSWKLKEVTSLETELPIAVSLSIMQMWIKLHRQCCFHVIVSWHLYCSTSGTIIGI